MKYTATVTVLWSVTWSTSEIQSTSPIYFENEHDAEKAAKVNIGWYGGGGSVYKQEYINGRNAPSKTYNTALEWAKDKLTYNQMVKHGFV